ncbi:serine hydrolase domain-containing protein [Sediminibacillus halophilus]|uniref:CubicO group peptidase, beta-lactamase class C family n=1 Tax=Sediminibacillus halophilus TaxID=482461 RepID=A0A1G9LPE8_9BACI|nr:serine hydrolase [Sediminibacillus halophilus]SDL63786.1 CubicO group peptidase, beta-lactamase class C family [Sediminibacillus halophilus]
MKQQLTSTRLVEAVEKEQFSGTIIVNKDGQTLFEHAGGYADKASQRLNFHDTKFGIASGCKLFTAIAVCQLVENGSLSFQTRLSECLKMDFPLFDQSITIHHLLTHSAGIPDYFDEEKMDDFEELWKQTPMYLMKNPVDFLPLFQEKSMKDKPGNRFHYNNAGYILLGLIIEQQTGLSISDYVEKYIFQPANMLDSGYFSLDQLPGNTAFGYIHNDDGTWRTNIYSIPIKGGADGGAFTTAPDMMKLWEALLNHQLFSKVLTDLLLTPHIKVKDGVEYGYGVWINREGKYPWKYQVMGYDPGVSFHSAHYPQLNITMAIPSNQSSGPFSIMKLIEEDIFRSGKSEVR